MKKFFSIASLVVFYTLIVLLGIVLLAAVQLRSTGSATFDAWRVNFEVNRHFNKELKNDLRNVKKESSNNEFAVFGNALCQRFFDSDGLLIEKRTSRQLMQEVVEARQKLQEITDAGQKQQFFQQLSGDAVCLIKGVGQIKSDTVYYQFTQREYVDKIRELEKTLAENEQQYTDLIKGHQDFLALSEMGTTWYQKPFIVAPHDFLVLLLVTFMGALGGIVRLLRDYGAANRQNPTTQEYYLIPLIGSVVAIGGYILAKTGLLLLSSSGNESSISPFMISLVGIISGLLAKEVIDTISARGHEILRKPDEGAQSGKATVKPEEAEAKSEE